MSSSSPEDSSLVSLVSTEVGVLTGRGIRYGVVGEEVETLESGGESGVTWL